MSQLIWIGHTFIRHTNLSRFNLTLKLTNLSWITLTLKVTNPNWQLNHLHCSETLACDCVPIRKAGGDYDIMTPRQHRKSVCVCVWAELHATGKRKAQCCLLEERQQWQESHHYVFLNVSESRSSGFCWRRGWEVHKGNPLWSGKCLQKKCLYTPLTFNHNQSVRILRFTISLQIYTHFSSVTISV